MLHGMMSSSEESSDERLAALTEFLLGTPVSEADSSPDSPSAASASAGNKSARKEEELRSKVGRPLTAKQTAIDIRRAVSSQSGGSAYLEFDWTFWTTDPNKDWTDAIERICDFSTAHGFWQLFNFVLKPSDLCHYSYNLFKAGIRPEWEDPANATGGRWNIAAGLTDTVADSVWLELCMLCVGGHDLDSLSACVNGIYLTWKKGVARVSVWLNTIDRDLVMRTGEIIQKTLYDHVGRRRFPLEFTECKPARARKALYCLD